jgi:hypothetical protein
MLKWMILGMIFAVSACASSNGGDPAKTVERYLRAKVEADAEAMRPLLCAEMEADLNRESRTFESVSGVVIEDMTCKRNEGADSVTCTGEIVATYGTENTTFPLITYRVAQEDGEWKYCGEVARF